MHFSEGGFTGKSASAHRFFGTTLAAFSVLVLVALCAPRGSLSQGQCNDGDRRARARDDHRALRRQSHARRDFFARSTRRFARVRPAAVHPVTAGVLGRIPRSSTGCTSPAFSCALSRRPPSLYREHYSPSARLAPEHIAALEAAAPQIVELNVQDAGLDDDELANLAQVHGAHRLRLGRNEITDRTVDGVRVDAAPRAAEPLRERRHHGCEHRPRARRGFARSAASTSGERSTSEEGRRGCVSCVPISSYKVRRPPT